MNTSVSIFQLLVTLLKVFELPTTENRKQKLDLINDEVLALNKKKASWRVL